MPKLMLRLSTLVAAVSEHAAAATRTLKNKGPCTSGGPNIGRNAYGSPSYFSINHSSSVTSLICNNYIRNLYNKETWQASFLQLFFKSSWIRAKRAPAVGRAMVRFRGFRDKLILFGNRMKETIYPATAPPSQSMLGSLSGGQFGSPERLR